MPVPPALSAWLRSAYPSVNLNPDWLEPCVEYVQVSANHPRLISDSQRAIVTE